MWTQQEQSDLDKQVSAARLRMLFDHVEVAMLASGVFAVVVAWLIHEMVPDQRLWPWLVIKLVCLLPRLMQAQWYARHGGELSMDQHPRVHHLMMVLMAVDGAAWGAVVWWLTPLNQLELGVITVSSLMGLAAIGAFMNALDVKAMACFIAPMLVPNVLYFLTRQDSVGLFGAVSIAGFMGVMIRRACW